MFVNGARLTALGTAVLHLSTEQEVTHLQHSSSTHLQQYLNLKEKTEKDKDRNREKKNKPKGLLKEWSQQYTDFSGIDLHEFLINTLKNNSSPDQRFCEHLKDEKGEESQKRFILKRDNSSVDKEEDQSVCTQENLFMEIRGNGASGSQQSSPENDLIWTDQRPWSSTDSDSSNRNLNPAIIKTSSFGGITVMTRGDSSGSNRSTGKLSTAGSSESSSSAGSSGSLSRIHQPLQNPSVVPEMPVNTSGSVTFPDNDISPSTTSYILLPLEATSIPPGSILLNPHTGQPFVNPDGTQAIYNPPTRQQVLLGQVAGQTSHQHQTQQQVQEYFPTQRDDVTAQFNQINLSRQLSGDTPEPMSGNIFPSGVLVQPSLQSNFVLPATNQALPLGSNQSASQTMQQLQTPQAFLQQSTIQMPVFYYRSGQYPTSANQPYKSIASVHYNAQRSSQMSQTIQQAGFQAAMSNHQQGYKGIRGMQQQLGSQNLMNNQQGSQMQGIMVQYPSFSSYQEPVSQNSQGIPQETYQHQIMLSNLSSQGTLSNSGVPVYCNVIPPPLQNNIRLISSHCPSDNSPVIPANCSTNNSSLNNTRWQINY